MGQGHDRRDVRVDLGLAVVQLSLDKLVANLDTRVVHQHVDGPVRVGEPALDRSPVCRIGEVGDQDLGPGARTAAAVRSRPARSRATSTRSMPR
jgi:hypothetical protein